MEEISVNDKDSSINTSTTRSSLTFNKRKGTTDLGKNYEHQYVAHLALKLLLDDTVDNFFLSSNNSKYGAFDDVVVETHSNNQIEIYAVQLKHVTNPNKKISGEHLSSPKGNFSLLQYLLDYEKNLKQLNKSVKMVLFTNSHFSTEKRILLNLDKEKVEVEAVEQKIVEKLNTSEKGKSYAISSKTQNDFFNNFLLYTDQANVEDIEKETKEMFKKKVIDREGIFKEFINFIENWSLDEMEKVKLNKSLVKNLIVLLALSPNMKQLSFSTNEISQNGKTFKQAVETFHATILKKQNFINIKNLWANEIKEVDLEEINKIGTKFKIISTEITCKEDLKKQDDKTNQLLWLLGKCPLVIKSSKEHRKVINLTKEKKFILLKSEDKPPSDKDSTVNIFQNLSDLKKEKSIYKKVLDTFVYSLENQKEAPLETLISLDESLDNKITTDELAQMIEEALHIGKKVEALPPCHISRSLSKVIVDIKFLMATRDNFIVISNVKDEAAFKKRMRNVEFSEDGKNTSCQGQDNHNVIYISRKEFDLDEFNQFIETKNFENCHQFKYLNNDCLEWVRSEKNPKKLKDFRVDHKYSYSVHESQLFGDTENSVNVVCANPGMGKSTLAKSIKNNSSSTLWTVIIYVRNHSLYFQKFTEDFQKMSKEKMEFFFQKFVGDTHNNDLDETILNLLIEKNKIRIIWDGLDEVSDDTLNKILNLVNTFGKNGIKQWITSRRNLVETLESKLKVISRGIKEFDKEQQQEYVKERLQLSSEELPDVFGKIENRVLFLNNDVLGIPLQIYMLTELLSRKDEREKFLDEETSYTTLNLYERFVEEKFYIYKKEKEQIDLTVGLNLKKFETEKNEKINLYKQVAFNFYIDKNLTTFMNFLCCWNVNHGREFLDKIAKEGDPVGFISRVNEGHDPEFSHNSFGEYFAALHIAEKMRNKARSKSFISDSKYNNIRFFVDLKLTEECKSHISILYRNYKLLAQCESNANPLDLEKLDEIHRKPLELSCAWSKKYPFVEKSKCLAQSPDDETLPRLEYKTIAKTFDKMEKSLHVCVKNLFLLLPFLVPFYNRAYHRFDEEDLPTVLFYAVKFDCAFIFTCSAKIPWLDNIHTKFDPKVLISLIIKYNSRKCLQELIEKKNYGDVLLRNFNFVLDSSSFKLYEYFSLLVDSVSSSLQSTLHGKSNTDMQALIKKCIKVNAPDKDGKMLIHRACESGDTKTVKLLIQEGATVDDPDSEGNRPLHHACEKGVYDIVKLLVDAGADVSSKGKNECTPMHYACQKGNQYIVELLLDKGAKVDVPDKDGRTPLHYTSFQNNHYFVEIVRLLSVKSENEKNTDL